MIIFCTENMFEQMPDKKPLLKYPIHITNAFEQAVSPPISAHVQPIQRKNSNLHYFKAAVNRIFFADRMFDLFDIKRKFGEFVRSLSIFHPNASKAEKI
ncbi:calcineurin B-like protein 1 [Prunus dulcis]|uniref:calcineurin B-like protein 1 n=1 Tax=Prunus dulcis TaxID=3755 RepID=UPI001483C996|nr:calcineurin B-like protein 1 [Prunus dulcis]XP_034225854.1 calcineurin B-like protein 1 [Prunus dulcis]